MMMNTQHYLSYIPMSKSLVESAVEDMKDWRFTYWDRKYPGMIERCKEDIGIQYPSPGQVALWKENWAHSTTHRVILLYDTNGHPSTRTQASDVCESLGIHPYFWEYQHRFEPVVGCEGNIIERNYPMLVFYSDEDAVMFKLAWGL